MAGSPMCKEELPTHTPDQIVVKRESDLNYELAEVRILTATTQGGKWKPSTSILREQWGFDALTNSDKRRKTKFIR